MSKNRVAPVRGITIPRPELMAALIGSRLLNFVKGQLKRFTRDLALDGDGHHCGPFRRQSTRRNTQKPLCSAMLTTVIIPPIWQRGVDGGMDLHFSSKKAGKLEHAALPEETIHPLLLSKSSGLTRLVVLPRYKESGHAGMSQTLANIRKRYWIPRIRATVKRVL
uniref:Integrase zinc-binding domain-containing protein n=1 Tax=Parascaris univalens TaxID=6257 RepID=A0A915CD42_PARUN